MLIFKRKTLMQFKKKKRKKDINVYICNLYYHFKSKMVNTIGLHPYILIYGLFHIKILYDLIIY